MKQCELLCLALLVAVLAANSVAEQHQGVPAFGRAAAGNFLGPNRRTGLHKGLASKITLLEDKVLRLEGSPSSSIRSHLHSSLVPLNSANIRPGRRSKPYNGVMFASGLSQGGKELVALRVCTDKCFPTASLDSTIEIGEAVTHGQRFEVTNLVEEYVKHQDDGKYTGPEDTRLDAVNNSVFLYFNMNVRGQRGALHNCEHYWDGFLRKMFFKWLGEEKACMLELPPASTSCHREKNWVSLVPPGNDQIFFVYSLEPLQIYKLDTSTCHMDAATGPFRDVVDWRLRGSSRYVKGIEVDGGSGYVYWALIHVKNKAEYTYQTLVSAIYVNGVNGTEQPYEFHLLGTSCAVRTEFKGVGDYDFVLPSSITNYDMGRDEADVTFHIDDKKVVRSKMHGVADFLQKAYSYWKSKKSPISCGNEDEADYVVKDE